MALLDRLTGVLTRQVTIGAYLTGDAAGTVYGGTVVAKPLVEGFATHTASGDAVRLNSISQTLNGAGLGAITVIRSDTPGLAFSADQGFGGFLWEFTIDLVDPLGVASPAKIVKTLRVDAGTGPLDLELAQPSKPVVTSGAVQTITAVQVLQIAQNVAAAGVPDGSVTRLKLDTATRAALDNAATGNLADAGVTTVKIAPAAVTLAKTAPDVRSILDRAALKSATTNKIDLADLPDGIGGVPAPDSVTPTLLAPVVRAQLGSSGPRDVRRFGAKVDGRVTADAAVASGSKNLTSATAAFTSADVGKVITVWNGTATGDGQVTHATTVQSVTNASTAVLTVAAPFTATARNMLIGTDDTAAINATITSFGGLGGAVYFPGGITVVTQTIVVPGGMRISGDGFDYSTVTTLISRGSVVALGASLPGAGTSVFELGDDGDSSLSGKTGAAMTGIAVEANHLAAAAIRTDGRRCYVDHCQAYHGRDCAFFMGGQNGYVWLNVFGQNKRGDIVIFDNHADNKLVGNQLREAGDAKAHVRLRSGTGDNVIQNNHMFSAVGSSEPKNNGVLIEGTQQAVSIIGNQMDSANGHQVLIRLPGGNVLNSLIVTDNVFWSVGGNGNNWNIVHFDRSGGGQVRSAIVATNTHFTPGTQGPTYQNAFVGANGTNTLIYGLSVTGNNGDSVRMILDGTIAPEVCRDNIVVRPGLTLDAGENLVGLSDAKGLATFSGDGSTKTFTISHGLALRGASTPGFYTVNPLTVPAFAPRTVTATASALTVTFATAPATGTSNVGLAWEATLTGLGSAPPPPPPTPPGKTVGLAPGAASSSTQALSWTATPTATSYLVERRLAGQGAFASGTTTSGTTVTITGLSAATSYDYQVTPSNDGGPGTASDVFTTSTAAAGVQPTGPVVGDRFAGAAGASLAGRPAPDGTQQPAWSTSSTDTNARMAIVPATGAAGASAGNQFIHALLDAGRNAYRLRTTVPTLLADPVKRRAMVEFRFVDTSNFWRLASHTDGKWKLQKLVGGAATVMATDTVNAAAGDVLEVVTTTTTVTVTINGRALGGTISDTTHAAATTVGLGGQFAASGGAGDTALDPTSTFGPIEVFAS